MIQVIACLASSLDGKIAYPNLTTSVGIGSRDDIKRLMTVRDMANGVIMGAETFRTWPKVRKSVTGKVFDKNYILTRTGNIPADSPLFSARTTEGHPVYTTIFCTQPLPGVDTISAYPDTVSWVDASGLSPRELVQRILSQAEADGVTTLLCEGGGHMMSLLLAEQALHMLYLTICPLLIGGQRTSSLVSGETGFSQHTAPRTRMVACEQVGQELFVDLAIEYPDGNEASGSAS